MPYIRANFKTIQFGPGYLSVHSLQAKTEDKSKLCVLKIAHKWSRV